MKKTTLTLLLLLLSLITYAQQTGRVIFVINPPEATVMVNGQRQDGRNTEVYLPVGKYNMTVSHPGWISQEKSFEVFYDSTITVRAYLYKTAVGINKAKKGITVLGISAVGGIWLGSNIVGGIGLRKVGKQFKAEKAVLQDIVDTYDYQFTPDGIEKVEEDYAAQRKIVVKERWKIVGISSALLLGNAGFGYLLYKARSGMKSSKSGASVSGNFSYDPNSETSLLTINLKF